MSRRIIKRLASGVDAVVLCSAATVLLMSAAAACGRAESIGAYAVGADISFLAQAEAQGRVFMDGQTPLPGLRVLKNHGYNWVRLRLFHTPSELPNDLTYTLAQAKAAKELGFRFLLNLHYSDTWADPEKQFLPKAWEGMTHEELVAAVRDYTHEVVATCCEAGARPDMVQVGNEVVSGMLWPDGKLPGRWPEFAELLKAGAEGVESGVGSGPRPLVMIHIDRGGDLEGSRYFFDKCLEHDVTFDVIGQSYYPWWHGSLVELQRNLAFLADRYERDVVLVEVAYNWRPAEYPDGGAPFPETPEGQRLFLEEVHRALMATPKGRGAGVFWWEPAVHRGGLASRGMFDDQGRSLPVLTVFDRFTRGRLPPRPARGDKAMVR